MSERISAAISINKSKIHSAPMIHFFEFRSKIFVFNEISEKISFGATFLPIFFGGKSDFEKNEDLTQKSESLGRCVI